MPAGTLVGGGVLASYLFAGLGRRLFGDGWYDERKSALHQRNARRVEKTILKLQGLFIKVGQLLSILANFLPEAFRGELEGLQDQVPPFPAEAALREVEIAYGRPASSVFAQFEPQALAAASIAQVHAARLRSGEDAAPPPPPAQAVSQP